jgi:hypothetical protein
MQTRTYGELIDLIQSLIGAGTMLGDEYLKIANFINRRYSEAYNTSPSWARYIVGSEERILYSILSSGLTGGDAHSNSYYYLLGDDSDGNAVYKSRNTHSSNNFIIAYHTTSNKWRLLESASSSISVSSDGVVSFTAGTILATSSTTNDSSPLDVFSWTNIGGVSGTLKLTSKRIVLYDDAEGNDINEFIRIHRKRAFFNNSAIEYDFFADVDGANILNVVNDNDSEVFVTYKIPLTLFTIAVSDPVVADDFINGGTTNGAANRALTVPLEFFNYIAHASYADFLRLEGKREEAQVEEAVARGYLNTELEKIDIRSNNNQVTRRFSTYVNRQSR